MRHAPLKREKTPALAPPLESATDAPELATDLSALVHETVTSTGQPLEAETRTSMERRFGHSFADVRVHSDDRAARSSELLNANAYTVAPNIVFGPSKYQPAVPDGQRLIAHELTHVVQQRSGPVASTPLIDGLALSDPGDPFERSAQSMADITGDPADTRESEDVVRSASSPSRFTYPGNSASGSLVLQRDPITINPVVVASDPDKEAQLQQKSDAMMNRFPEVWRGFCRDWQIQATSALASVPDPPNPYEARNFWIALAGNMAWAATSITVVATAGVGAGAVAVIGASAVGAGAGSGALAKSGPPSGRGQAATALAAQRDKMETLGTRSMFADVAMAAIDKEQAEQDEALWKKFAPTIPFATRATVMLANAQSRLTSWFAQFQTQYIAWKERDDVVSKARDYEMGEISSEPFGDPISLIADVVGVGTPADRFFEQAQADIPFTPTFGG